MNKVNTAKSSLRNIVDSDCYAIYQYSADYTRELREIDRKVKAPTLSRLLYPGRESNPHSRRNWILNPARLPVPPPGHFSLAGCKFRFFIEKVNMLLNDFV